MLLLLIKRKLLINELSFIRYSEYTKKNKILFFSIYKSHILYSFIHLYNIIIKTFNVF